MSPRVRAAVAGAVAAAVWGLQEPLDQRRLALALALGEHVASWPFISLVDRGLVTSPRAFAQSTYRHALFGMVLGRLA